MSDKTKEIKAKQVDLSSASTKTCRLEDAPTLSRLARIDYIFRHIERAVRNASRIEMPGSLEVRQQMSTSGKSPQISMRLLDKGSEDFVGPYIIFRADDKDGQCILEIFTKEERQSCSLLDEELFRRIKFIIKRQIEMFIDEATLVAERRYQGSDSTELEDSLLNEQLVAIEVDNRVDLSEGEAKDMRKMLGGIFGDTEEEATPLQINGTFDLEGSLLPRPDRGWAGKDPEERVKETPAKDGNTTWILAKKKHTVVAERYVLRKLLGAGGMGAVFTADDRKTRKRVAIKILHQNLSEDEVVLQRFYREVKLIQKVTHNNVIEIFDHGSHDNVIYYTMECVKGLPLNKIIQGRKLKRNVLEGFAIQIVHGLKAIHEAGIIHRDLKGENVIVTESRDLKIIDFGIARTNDSNLTSMGEVIGSPAYLAPELWRGETPTEASDMYALGVIFYRMAYGHLPHTGDNPVAVMNKHLHEEPDFSKEMLTTASPWFVRLAAALLEKDKNLRPDVSRVLDLLNVQKSHS